MTTAPAPALKRRICPACLRPGSTCICAWITPTATAVEVVILQHPLEVGNAKGSARLLHLSLPNSRLLIGDVFEVAALQALLAQSPRRAILLYPDTPKDQSPDLSPPPVLSPDDVCDPSAIRLIVLDGTWRKSRKMLYQNPLLQQLPRLALRDMPASHYLIRKAHLPDQLSTLEATCAALMQLEGQVLPLQPLLTAFDGFVAQQLGYRKKQKVRSFANQTDWGIQQ